jgi:hypothetical protein
VVTAVGQLLVHGGSSTYNGTPTNTLVVFGLKGGAFSYLSAGPKLWGHTAVTTYDKSQIFVFGGRNASQSTQDIYSYIVATDTWTRISANGSKVVL